MPLSSGVATKATSGSPRSWLPVTIRLPRSNADGDANRRQRVRPQRALDRIDPGLSHRVGDVGVGHLTPYDGGGVVEDLAGIAIVGLHVEGLTRLGSEGVVTGRDGLGHIGPGGLRGVADDGPRRVASAPPEAVVALGTPTGKALASVLARAKKA